MSKESILILLRTLKLADDEKRAKSDLPIVSNRVNWSYLIDAVEELKLL